MGHVRCPLEFIPQLMRDEHDNDNGDKEEGGGGVKENPRRALSTKKTAGKRGNEI
jgi:hypothetical protein